jgi:hypothetical protein
MVAFPWREMWRRFAVLRVHPRHLAGPEDGTLISVWAAYRRDGMGGSGHLPFGGGWAQQPAALMKALDDLSATAARIREKMSPTPPSRGRDA